MRTYVCSLLERKLGIVFPSLVNILCRTIAPFSHKRMRMVPNTCRKLWKQDRHMERYYLTQPHS